MTGAPTPPAVSAREADARVAVEVKALQAAGRLDEARERFAELIDRHQRRAGRIAFHYLRNAADGDEGVQDAFVKAYMHLGTFREELPFEIWFTRILINGCLDRLKARRAANAGMAPPVTDAFGVERDPGRVSPCRRARVREEQVLSNERRRQLSGRSRRLPQRQRLIFMLSHYEGRSSREVSGMTGLNEFDRSRPPVPGDSPAAHPAGRGAAPIAAVQRRSTRAAR